MFEKMNNLLNVLKLINMQQYVCNLSEASRQLLHILVSFVCLLNKQEMFSWVIHAEMKFASLLESIHKPA